MQEIPLPPMDMRVLVGPTAKEAFDNPSGELIFPGLPETAWEKVLDFGCGCGRLARQLLQQRPRPREYVGIDLHRGMIRWCETNLTPHDPGFRFVHQDIFNPGFNPEGTLTVANFPVPDHSVSLVLAWSVFTHLLEDHVVFYLKEMSRVLQPQGWAILTCFLFEKKAFPMMQDFQNALYINLQDPSNAVILDRDWFRSQLRSAGLVPVEVKPPTIRGFQWVIRLRPAASGAEEVDFPEDRAPFGSQPSPLCPPGASECGLSA